MKWTAAVMSVAMTSAVIGQPAGTVNGTSTATGPNGTTVTVTTVNGPAAAQAQAQARTAQIGADYAALPGTGINPAATAGTNAGMEEGSLLVAASINAAANEILHQRVILAAPSFLIVAGNTGFDLTAWKTFDIREKGLTKSFTEDLGKYEAALKAATAKPRAPGDAKIMSGGFGGAAEETLGLAAKVLSYFATNYSASGVQVSTSDYMLAIAVASRAPGKSVVYSQMIALDAQQTVEDSLKPLAALADKAQAATLKGNPLTDAQKKAKAALSDRLDGTLTTLKADLTAYNGFLTGLYGGVSGTSVVTGNLPTIVQQYAAHQVLEANGGILYVQIHNAAGGLISKTNIWSTLGAMPLYASGGVVVSYAYYAKPSAAEVSASQTILKAIAGPGGVETYTAKASGLFGVATPYHTIGHVPTVVALDKSGACDALSAQFAPKLGTTPTEAERKAEAALPEPTEDAGKYCPR